MWVLVYVCVWCVCVCVCVCAFSVQYCFSIINALCVHFLFCSRCNKIISMAEAAYQQDLPPFYVTAYHLSKVVGSFSLHTSCWLGKKKQEKIYLKNEKAQT